ncbi:MAG: zinc ABC transporter substrate-binding protein [Devosia sp.]
MRLLPILAFGAALFLSIAARGEVPRVVATIKPIHSLVAAVMGDLGAPALIVKGGASPHTYSLKPSDAQALEAADLVFWTGHGLELFLEEALETLAVKARVVELAADSRLELLPVREGGAFEPHAEEEDEHAQEAGANHGETDMHFWLDPINATKLTAAIADALAGADPEHGDTYFANARAYDDELNALTSELDASLADIKAKPFIVFHDAYQYFERRFGLSVAGALTVTPDSMPGARRVGELRKKIKETSAGCVFAEPQFQPAIVSAIIEGTGAKAGELDPEGANLPEGPGLYRQLLENLARGLKDCLGGR